MPADRTESTSISSWRPALALFVVVVAVYGPCVGGDFHFDDWHVIAQNPMVRSLANVPRFFTDARALSILRDNVDLRPLLMMTFALNWSTSGAETWSYHVVNLFLHWATALLVFRIVRDLLWLGSERRAVAWIAALLFAVHPLGTESVAYVSARSALLVTVCYLAAFDAAVRGRVLAATLFGALAMATKAIAVTMPLVVLVHVALVREAGRRRAVRAAAALAIVAIAGIAYRLLVLPPWALAATHDPAAVTPWTYWMTSWSAYLHYVRLFLWPDALVVDHADYPLVTSFGSVRAWGSLGVLGLASLLAWRARRRRPATTFAWTWFIVTLLPEQSLFPLAEPVNDHRAYLAMPGLVVLAALAVQAAGELLHRFEWLPAAWATPALVGILVAALGAATIARNRVWRDDYALWIDATRKVPRNPRAWLNAGQAALSAGRLDDADALLAEAHRLAPCYAYVQLNQSAIARRRRDTEGAVARAREAVACRPQLALAHLYLGHALEEAGQSGTASDAYRAAAARDDRLAGAWAGLGRTLAAAGAWTPAARAWERAARADRSDPTPRVEAAVLHRLHTARPGRAVRLLRGVLAATPTHYGARYQLAVALLAVGDDVAARIAWDRFEALAKAERAPIDSSLVPPALRTR